MKIKKELPSYLKETTEIRKKRLAFQKDNGVDLRTKVVPDKKKYKRSREKAKLQRLSLAY